MEGKKPHIGGKSYLYRSIGLARSSSPALRCVHTEELECWLVRRGAPSYLTHTEFLSTLGAVQAGDGNHFSIGGPPGVNLPVVGGLLGQPRGIWNSHNRFEGDASPTRGDLYQL